MNDADGCFPWNAYGSIRNSVEVAVVEVRVDIEFGNGLLDFLCDPWVRRVIHKCIGHDFRGMT